jgi:hypothetical protein
VRIELIIFDAGGGHRSAATALSLAVQQQGRPWELSVSNLQDILEPLDLSRRLFGIRLEDFYNLIILKKNWTLGARHLLRLMHGLIRLRHGPAVELLEAHFRRGQPDLVVSLIPHFNRALWEGLRRACPKVPFVTLLTDLADYPPHFWIERQPQYFICGSARAVEQARELGHPAEAVYRVSGMILHPRFYRPLELDRAAERRRLGLDPERPTGLVLFGGHGSHLMLRIARRLEASGLPVQLILLCGRNEKLRRALDGMKSRLPMHVEGFTTEVPYYMRLADFFIGKPGPGSLSEAAAMKLPVIVTLNAWTLPHERYNAAWVHQQQLGLVAPSFRRIERAVAQMLAPGAMSRFAARAAALDNRAVYEAPDLLEQIAARGPL